MEAKYKKNPRLTKEEELLLLKNKNDPKAQEKLVDANMHLVWEFVKKYIKNKDREDIPMYILVERATMALIKTIEVRGDELLVDSSDTCISPYTHFYLSVVGMNNYQVKAQRRKSAAFEDICEEISIGYIIEKLSPLKLLEAVKLCDCLEYVPKNLKTAELCLEAVKHSGAALEYVPKKLITYEMCLMAVKMHHDLIAKVPKEFKESKKFWLELFRMEQWCFWYMPEKFKTLDVCIEAVKQEYLRFMLVPESLKERVLEATGIQERMAKIRPKNISAQEKDFFKKEVEKICIKLTEFCQIATREGILALEEYIDKEQLSKKALLETGLKMMMDGKHPKIIEKYMDSWIKANCVTYCEKILASIIRTGVLCIERCFPWAAEYKMTALIPRDLIPDSLLPTSKKYFRKLPKPEYVPKLSYQRMKNILGNSQKSKESKNDKNLGGRA